MDWYEIEEFFVSLNFENKGGYGYYEHIGDGIKTKLSNGYTVWFIMFRIIEENSIWFTVKYHTDDGYLSHHSGHMDFNFNSKEFKEVLLKKYIRNYKINKLLNYGN